MPERVSFRVYCDDRKRKHRRYYTVYIFTTRAAMFEHFKRTNIGVQWRKGYCVRKMNFHAIAQHWQVIPRRSPENIGQILFYAGYIGAGVVTHEMSHAAVYYAKHVKLDIARIYNSKRIDERFARMLGELVRQFWLKYWSATRRVAWLKSK
jgi:hypothetical protein